jgi:2,3-bisphosphoglycerate-independent phosphoglycerate mutase
VHRLEQNFTDYDFHFVHFKAVDSRGEDGDFGAKVKAIEAVDALIPQVEALAPDVIIITGDHSTPARLRAHSWHAVPIMIVSPDPDRDATTRAPAPAANWAPSGG